MNELQAALGLAVLDCVADEVKRRQAIIARYRERLGALAGVTVMPEPAGVESSCQYFVIRIDRAGFGATRDEVFDTLKRYNVLARKYFFPLCTDYACYSDLPSAAPGRLPVARTIVNQVLCLPLYGTLPLDAVDTICDIVQGVQATA